MQKITLCIWCDMNAKVMMDYYKNIFKNSEIVEFNGVMGVMQIEGQNFQFLNGGPMYKFTEALSLSVSTNGQDETDYYWNALTKDGG